MATTGTLFYPALLMIDNVSLTDQGRAPVTVSRNEKSVESELANGSTHKYFKAIKRTWSTSWEWLSDDDTQNIDGGAGRNTMSSLLADSKKTHVLRFYDENTVWQEYTVWVTTYDEEIFRRDPNTGLFFWNVTLELGEV